MAASPGKLGTINYAGGNVATLNNWTLDIGNEMLDVTPFTTTAPQWRDVIAGLSGFTGTIAGVFDGASTGQNDLITNTLTPVAATVILEKDQTVGGKYTGSVLLSGMSIGVAVDGLDEISWDLQGTGALTFTTTT